MNEFSNLGKAVLRTLAYFDIFDFPLTSWEVWQWLDWPDVGERISHQQVSKSLEALAPRVASTGGFYFLSGRRATVQSRAARYLLAERKFKKFRRIAKLLAFFPFIRMIAVCNTLAYSNSRDQADIDVFIIVRSGRLWISRFLSVCLMQLLGQRPRPENERDKICLSFWVSEKNLNLKPLMIGDDVYLRYWLNQLVPVYMEDKYFIKFVQSNLWLRKKLPNFVVYRANTRRRVKLGLVRKWIKRRMEQFLAGRRGDLLEERLKNFQLKKMPKHLSKLANKSSDVVISDSVLKFHSNDRRVYYRDLYLKKISQLGAE